MENIIYLMLGLTSLVGLTFIAERAWCLRWSKVVPLAIANAVADCHTPEDVAALRQLCESKPSPLGRLLLTASNHLAWPKI